MDLAYLFHQEDIRNAIINNLSLKSLINLKIALGKNITYQIKDKDNLLIKPWHINLKEYPIVKFVEKYRSISLSKFICKADNDCWLDFFKKYSWEFEEYPLEMKCINGNGERLVSSELNLTLDEMLENSLCYSVRFENGPELICIPRDRGLSALEFLAEHGFNMSDLLFDAVTYQRTNLALFLLEKGTDPNCIIEGPSVLCMAVQNQNFRLITNLVDSGADINYTYWSPFFPTLISPIVYAIITEDIEVIKKVIDLGANLTPRWIQTNEFGMQEHNPLRAAEEIDVLPEIIDLIVNHTNQ